MAQATTTNPTDFANRRVAYLENKVLKTLEYQLRMEQFADKKTAPSKGTYQIRFFRARKARKATNTAGPQNLTEGGGQGLRESTVTVGYLDCFLNQRGDDFQISDIAEATDVLDTLKIYSETIGMDAALDYDQIITNSVMGNASTANLAKALGLGAAQTTLYGSNNTYGTNSAPYFERFAGIVNTGVSSVDFGTLAGNSAAQSKFTRLEHLRCITQMKANDIMPKDGSTYPVVTPPQVIFDIRQDTTLVSAMTQRDNQLLYKWEKFEMDGGAFIESTNPWQEAAGGYGTYNSTGGIFTTLYIGDDPFGTVMISDKRPGGSPAAPKLVILDKPDKSDLYNQYIAGAWKAYYGSILKLTSDASDVPHVVALRSQTSFK